MPDPNAEVNPADAACCAAANAEIARIAHFFTRNPIFAVEPDRENREN
jgi:hypothetical protein